MNAVIRIRAQFAAALACTLLAAGCGDAMPTVAGGRSLAGQTVEVAATWTGAEQANFRAVLDAFAHRTGATVKYTSGGDDLPVLLGSRLAGGAPPDVALIAQPGVMVFAVLTERVRLATAFKTVLFMPMAGWSPPRVPIPPAGSRSPA